MIDPNDKEMQSYLLSFGGGQGAEDVYIPTAQVVKAYAVLLSPDKMYNLWTESGYSAKNPHLNNPLSKADVLETMDEQYNALSTIMLKVFIENKVIHIGELSIWATEVEDI